MGKEVTCHKLQKANAPIISKLHSKVISTSQSLYLLEKLGESIIKKKNVAYWF